MTGDGTTADRQPGIVREQPRTPRLGFRAAAGLFVLVAVVQTLSPAIQVTDSRLSVAAAYSVVHGKGLALETIPSVRDSLAQTRSDVVTAHGHTLPFFPWAPMLFAVPGVVIADAAGLDVADLRTTSPNRTFLIEVPTAALLVAVSSVLVALVAFELAESIPRRRRFALVAGLLFAFGTGAWSTASRSLWSQTPAMAFASLAVLAALRSRTSERWLWVLGVSLSMAAVMRPTAAVPLVVLAVWSVLTRRSAAWRVGVSALVVLGAFALVNIAIYGRAIPPYYRGNRLGTEASLSFANSLAVHLISPSRGLFIYTPFFLLVPVALYLKRQAGQLTSLDLAVTVIVLVHALVVAQYGSTGGSAYGSRFFTDILPYLVYLTLPALAAARVPGAPRALVVGVATLAVVSVVLTAPGALSRAAFCWSATPKPIDASPARLWQWSDPQFFRPVKDLTNGAPLRTVLIGSCTSSNA